MKVDFTKLDKAFNPQCIAVVGDKGRLQRLHAQSTFKGTLYSVQIGSQSIKAIEALGVKNFTSLLDIPDPVDLAIVAVPRAVVPRILEDCIHKGVAAANFYAAGFAETNTEEGRELEKSLSDRAKQANFHLIGPNGVGIFNPELGLRQNAEQYVGMAGTVGLIAQSGTHAGRFSTEAYIQGVDINKAVSLGNGAVLDSADFLAYFGRQADIKAIGMYVEGIKSGRRFLNVLKEVAARKPVVIWKGGRSEEGRQAGVLHTGAMAISQDIWDAAIRQCGAVNVRNMEELIDTLGALLYLPSVHGNRIGVAGTSGGQSVVISDVFAEAGLSVPLLTQESRDKFAEFFNPVGGSYRNPIDAGVFNRPHLKRILEILAADANVDNIAIVVWNTGSGIQEALQELSLVIEVKKRTKKPLVVILPYALLQWEMPQIRQATQNLRDNDIPTFFTLERGARALKNAWDYYRCRNKSKGDVVQLNGGKP
ncbi:MAG: CoA-binding protein [Candidatus Omnitrophica bacterium]|nr:CoA-binding protein [Candidatus Omnitrophota bacterium]